MWKSFYDYVNSSKPLWGRLALEFDRGQLLTPLWSYEHGLLFGMNSSHKPLSYEARRTLQDLNHEKQVCAGIDIYNIVRLFAEGPKVFRPTLDECMALEEVEIPISITDYTQPFPTFVVEFPHAYAEKRQSVGVIQPTPWSEKQQKGYVPFAVIVRHEPILNMLLFSILCSMGDRPRDGFSVCMFIRPDVAGGWTIEDGINNVVTNTTDTEGAETDTLRWCLRVAVNACLLLTNYGCRHVGPACEPSHMDRLNRHLEKSKKRGDGSEGKAAIEMLCIPQVYSFSQTVSLRNTVGRCDDAVSNPTGRTVGPHRRRAHWRNQRWGVGLTAVKRIIVPHTMIHPELFLGLPSDGTTTYEG